MVAGGGACMVAGGRGCVVARGGHAWLPGVGVHGCQGGAWLPKGEHVWQREGHV